MLLLVVMHAIVFKLVVVYEQIVVCNQVCVVLIFVVGLIFYSITINVILAKDAQIAGISSTITSVSASVANLIVIIILGTLYQKLAVLLTKWGKCSYI